MPLPKVPHLTFLTLPATGAAACAILILLCLPSSTWGEEYCGMVLDSQDKSLLNLTEGQTLSHDNFEKIKMGKLESAKIVSGPKCAVQICGFTSIKEGYIGATREYADCRIFGKDYGESVPADIFNRLYNVSSIGCGCMRDSNQCTQTCESRMAKLKRDWKKGDCAVLYQENQCNACYLPPVNLTVGKSFKTDNSHSIRTMVVRENCSVKQYIPALKNMTRFDGIPQPFVYSGSNNAGKNVTSAFQSSPEYFRCDCTQPIPPLSPTTVFLLVATGFVGTFALATICGLALIYLCSRSKGSSDETKSVATQTTPYVEGYIISIHW